MSDMNQIESFVRDIWTEFDRRFRTDEDLVDASMISWLNILGVLQYAVSSVGLDRVECGLPREDADTLFFLYRKKPD